MIWSIHGGAVSAREDLVASFCGVAPITRGMHYAVSDGAFAQQLDTVGAAIQRALPQNSTAVYAKKGCRRIEKCNGRTLRKWDSVESRNCNVLQHVVCPD